MRKSSILLENNSSLLCQSFCSTRKDRNRNPWQKSLTSISRHRRRLSHFVPPLDKRCWRIPAWGRWRQAGDRDAMKGGGGPTTRLRYCVPSTRGPCRECGRTGQPSSDPRHFIDHGAYSVELLVNRSAAFVTICRFAKSARQRGRAWGENLRRWNGHDCGFLRR